MLTEKKDKLAQAAQVFCMASYNSSGHSYSAGLIIIGLSYMVVTSAGEGAPDNAYECRECGLLYGEKEWARKCEEWCSRHKSCNIDIMKHAIKKA